MKKIAITTLCAAFIALMISCSQKEENSYAHHSETNYVELGYESPTNYKELSFDEDVREIKHEIKEGFSYAKEETKDNKHEVKK
ncbi:MAG: hypothetical protein JWO58_145 [Chitinophagaceae bacterium]|nr:hypothetical protein [Chitinophagaceae bacterium]